MDPMVIQWATQAYKLDAEPISSQRCVNYYGEREPEDAKVAVAVLAAPGLNPFLTVGSGGIRGFNVMNNVLYVVSGTSLYSVTVGRAITLLGTGIAGFLPVSMANNGSQVMIVNGVNGWIYAPSSTFNAATSNAAVGGSNYAIGDTVTVAGGTYLSPAVLQVLTLSGSAIATVSVQIAGQYSVVPINPVAQATTSGAGSGATFNLTFNGPPVGFTKITDTNFYPANTTTFYDEYFILDRALSNNWFFSNILDGTTYGALDFETAEVQSDYVVGLVNQQENLLVFGQKSIETWYDTGANDNPFARYNAATIERGCAAPLTLVKEDNAVFFLGDDLVFYRLDGVIIKRVSTHAIESKWQSYATMADAYAYSYTFNGHKFIVLSSPTGNSTFVHDISSSLWHERVSYVAATPSEGIWRGACAVEFAGLVLIGDMLSGQIGSLSQTTYTEFGQPMIGIVSSPPLHKDRKRIFLSCLELNMRTGVGLSTGQGSDPQVMLEISKDQGETWGTRQVWHSLGKIGAYGRRLRWKKLGKSRDWRFRVSISDPVPRDFVSSFVNVETEEQ